MFRKHLIPYYHTAQVMEMGPKEYHLLVTNVKLGHPRDGKTPYSELVRIYQSRVVAQKACDKILNAILSARRDRAEVEAKAAEAKAAEAALDYANWQLCRRPPR